MTPIRIQRKRTKGWRMPPNTVYVGRPTKWGNPFTIQAAIVYGHRAESAQRITVEAYRLWILGDAYYGLFNSLRNDVLDHLDDLHGHDLACWCPLKDEHGNHVPCHADVLLELANDPR